MLLNNIKIAWRNLKKHATHGIINIGGLALSIAIVLLIALWVQYELRFDTQYEDADHIFLLSHHEDEGGRLMETSPYKAYETIPKEIPEVASAAIGYGTKGMKFLITVKGNSLYENNAVFIDSNWIKIFNYRLLAGSFDFLKEHSSRQIAISQSKAQQYFGNSDAVGKSLELDSLTLSVGAVFADPPSNSSITQDILFPYSLRFQKEYEGDALKDWDFSSSLLFLKLRADAVPSKVSEKITRIFNINTSFTKEAGIYSALTSLPELYWSTDFRNSMLSKGNKNRMRVLGVLSILLLLIASINFVNLSIARGTTRNKEMGIRKVNGASKRQLFFQMMVETVLSIAMAIVLAVVIAELFLPYFNRFFDSQLSLSFFSGRTIFIVVVLFLLLILLTGIYPAALLSNVGPLQLFKDKVGLAVSAQKFREVLLVTQLVVAVCAVVAALVIHLQFRYIQQETAAYKKEQIFSFYAEFPGEMRGGSTEEERFAQKLNHIKTELLNYQAIRKVSRVDGISMIDQTSMYEFDYRWSDQPKPTKFDKAVFYGVDADYLAVSDLKLLKGRWFDSENTEDRRNIVINQTAIKKFGLREPVLGKSFIAQPNSEYASLGTIIGIVKDFHHGSFHNPIQPVIFQPDFSMGYKFIVRAQSGQVSRALKAARSVWERHYPNHPFEYKFLDEEFNQLYKADIRAATFSLIFTSLTVIISCLGILGIALFSARQRTKEVGIRKALGASVFTIVFMLTKNFAKMVFLAILIGVPIIWWALSKWLYNFAYQITLQWWMIACGGLVIMIITLITVGMQSLFVARENPVNSLKDE